MTTKAVRLTLILILIVSLAACASWKQNTTAGYEITGATLTQIHDAAKMMCDAGTIKEADCLKIKSVYNTTRKAFIAAGNSLIVAINAEDAVTKKKSLEAYQKSMNDIAALVPELLQLAQDLGIATGGN